MGMRFRNAALVAAALVLGLQQPAVAQGNGALTSKIELEKPAPAQDGQTVGKIYTAPDMVVPGDRVRITLTFTNSGASPASGVNITNPIPVGLIFDGTLDNAHFSVSVDGGKSFGALDTLTVAEATAGARPATAADVTHVRWLWPDAVPAGAARSVAFFGKVK